jgi:hypothetical protein
LATLVGTQQLAYVIYGAADCIFCIYTAICSLNNLTTF